MSETVIIIGAGVSKGSGAPVMKDFLDVADRLRRNSSDPQFDLVFRGLDALQAVHSKAAMDLINLESVFAAFEMAKLLGGLNPLTPAETNELHGAMVHLIQRTLEETISFRIDNGEIEALAPYRSMAEIVARGCRGSPSGRVSFISFNYDVCLDHALYKQSLMPDYCLDSASAVVGGIRLLKLHGSLNWTRCPSCHKIVPWHLGEFFKTWAREVLRDRPSPNQPLVRLRIASFLTQFRHCGNLHAREPFITPPTWSKTQYHGQLETVWQAAAQELSTAENILICGYSLSEADQFFRYLFALGSVGHVRFKKFWVVNPDREVEPRFRQLCGQSTESRFLFLAHPLENNENVIKDVMS